MKNNKKKNFRNEEKSVPRSERTDHVEIEGVVIKVLPQTFFEVQCGQSVIICTLSGKMRQNRIRIIEGDKVRCEVSSYDLSRGRISRRL